MCHSKSPLVSRTLNSILAILKNVEFWMVSICPLISKSSITFNNNLVTVPKVSVMIGIIVTFMFHSFFNSLARSRYLSFFPFSLIFISWSAGPMGRESGVQFTGRVIPKSQKMILDAAFLNTLHYKARVKWSNPGKGVVPRLTPRCCSY